MVMKMQLIVILVVLIAGPCHATPMENYTPQQVKPLFNQMRVYGEKKKKESGINYRQYLVLLVASHGEILYGPIEDFTDPHFTHRFETGNYKDRVRLVINQDQQHGEIQCTHDGILAEKLANFRQIKPNDFPIVMMYSYYIPCADIPNLGYSCSEELAIFASWNSQTSGLLVAYTEIFNRTDEEKAKNFMLHAGIPAFRFQETHPKIWELVSVYTVQPVQQVPLLFSLFECISKAVNHARLSENTVVQKQIIAFYVNSMAYQCFSKETVRLRDSNRQHLQSCFCGYARASIGDDSRHSERVAEDKQYITACANKVFHPMILLPGQPVRPFDPYSYSWESTSDPLLSQVFPQSPDSSRGRHQISCLEADLTLESLCTRRGSRKGPHSPSEGPSTKMSQLAAGRGRG